jgi:hypothetical protein
MRRFSSSRAVPRGLVGPLLSLPLALLVVPSTAWAVTVPAPSPGPANVPLTAPGGAVISLSGALLAAVLVALATLLIVVVGRRQRNSAVATERVAPRPVVPDRAEERAQADLTAPAASSRAEEEERKLAA